MILNAAVTFSLLAPPPTSRKLAGLFAVELDDVHRRHGEAGAVDHAADRAVERDVGEVVFRGLDLLLVFLGLVAQRDDVRVAEERVVVERHLGVEHAQLAVLHDDQRVDLEHRSCPWRRTPCRACEQLARLLGEIARELQRLATRCFGRDAA
jgi:hypothetical protein